MMVQSSDNKRPKRGHGARVLQLASALALLLALLVTVLVAFADRRAVVDAAHSKAHHAAQVAAAEIRGTLTVVDVVMAQAIELAGPGDQPIADSREVWEEVVRLGRAAPFIEALWFGGPDGAAILSSHQFPAPPLSAADRDYFIEQRDRDPGLYLGVVQRDRYTASRSLVFSRRLERPDGSFRGFVTVTISPDPLRQALSRVAEGMLAAVMRADGVVIAGLPAEQVETDASRDQRFAQSAGTNASGSYLDEVDSEHRRLIVFQRIEPMELFVRVDVPLKPITDQWVRNRLPSFVLVGVAAVLSILAWSWIVLSRTRQAEVTVEELERARSGLEERISAHTDSLRRANQRLAEAVADKEVLYREVHHRVKNNLQVVTSLLQLQAARLAPEIRRPFEESVARISAMSLVHELLYRSDQPSRIDFSLYLRAVAEALLDRRGEFERVGMKMDAEPVFLDLDRAVPLALLTNELLGTVLDHAFPEGRSGALVLRLHGEENGARLAIQHDGITDGQMPTGFSLLLVDALAGQIGASVIPDQGSGFQIFVPLPRVSAERSRAAS
jgi:two-component system, sensor histidine kinase PdtaS